MVNQNDKYGLCSLCLIRKLHINPKEAITAILHNAISNYAIRVVSNGDAVLNCVIYDYYNNNLSPGLNNWFEGFIKAKQFNPDKGLRGFNGEAFDPSFERKELAEVALCYPDFEMVCIEYYQFKKAMQALNLAGDITAIINNAKIINEQILKYEDRFGKDATFMVKIETLLQFNNDDKIIYEFELLAAFVGIKSIIGKKDFCSTTKSFIVMRMVGAKSQVALQESLNNPAISNVYERYNKRYHFDKLLIELQKSNFISAKIGMAVGVKSRLFISCHLDYNLLPIAVANYLQSKKNKNIHFKIKTQERAAIEKIRELTAK
ncbi:hypothetical protein [Mucilaginibacter sp. L196]|uniref:hypothetical protein n=1 Tax=Mucilaginibacter sp. L196 TaxID=1641870 RepID=UPI00131B87D1|nr:hypothetical protein [Mucilaginibacter sp. L196]